jgi:hypothetical protein
MIEEDFYSTIKLKSGEEIFAKVAATEEEDGTFLLVTNPIVVECITNRNGDVTGYKMEPWLKTTTEDLFIININDVLTMSESKDIEMISLYQSFCRNLNRISNNQPKMTRRMGYLSNVNDAKEILEKLFKNS